MPLKIKKDYFFPNNSRIIGNIGWMSVERIVRLGLGLLVGLVVARYLGPSNFGLLNFVITFSVLFETVSSLGLDYVLIKKIIESAEKQFRIISTGFYLRLAVSLLLIPIAYFVITAINTDPSVNLLTYFILSTILFRAVDVTDFWFQAHLKSKYSVYSKIISFSFYGLTRLLFIYLGFSIVSFGLAFFIEGLLRSVLMVVWYLKAIDKPYKISFDQNLAVDLLKTSWPLLFSAITVMIYMNIDIIMLGAITSAHEVGIYTSVVRISEILYNIPVIITGALFPVLIEYRRRNIHLYNARFQLLYDLLIPSMIAIALLFSVFSEQLIKLLYGEQYLAGSSMLVIHVWSGVFISYSVLRGKWLIAEGLELYTFIAQGLGALINIVLNFFLIPKYGGIGASVATLISYGFATTASSFIFTKLRKEGLMEIKSLFPFYRLKALVHKRSFK